MSKRKQAIRGQSKTVSHARSYELLGALLKSVWLRKISVAAVFSALLFMGYEKLIHSDVLVIESVQIEGEFKYLSKQNLQNSTLPYVSGGFFSVNIDRVRNHLIQLPWVEDVSIRRQWPNALRIRVIEKQPVAFWGDDQLLSAKANIFEPTEIDKEMQLPKLTGPAGQHQKMLMELGRMQAWLVETGLVIKQINQDERRSWTLIMESGLELRLGRSNQHGRLHRFVNVYTEKLATKKQNIKHIDMRYTNGLAVAWKKAPQDLGA